MSKGVICAGALLLGGALASSAGNVTLTANDGTGTSSFTGLGNWNPVGTPSAGNDYFTSIYTLRTPAPTSTSGNNYIFGGDSLSIDSGGGRILGKIGNGVPGNTIIATITVNNLILDGGDLLQAGSTTADATLIVAGNVSVTAASRLGAAGPQVNGGAHFERLEFTAPISGSAALQVSGSDVNNGKASGLVKLSAANPYSGTITVSSAGGLYIASAINRILQLNNLNALSNATLNLEDPQTDLLSFASGVNSGAFNIGALAGNASQSLTDTAGSPVTLSVGGNNASTTYSGALTGGGSLVKVGSGTLTLTGANSYSGGTSVNGGSLQLGNGGVGGSLYAGNALTLKGNLIINRNNAVVQGVDFSASPITGTGSLIQAGDGTTLLNAANSYSGTTTVSAGRLVISSAQTGTGAVTVADGAGLGITVSGGSQFAPTSLMLGASAATTLGFDGVNSTTVAPINTGTLAMGGSVTIKINSGIFAAGNSYPLIHWTGSGPADASSFTLGFSPGLTADFSVSRSTLYLNVTAWDIWGGTAPLHLTAIPGVSKIILSWQAVDGGVSYNVKRSTSSGTEVTITNVTDTSFIDMGLASGTTYYYKVSAVNENNNESRDSSEASATPSDQPILKVYLQGGQSNADGRALTNGLPVSLLNSQDDVPLYYYLNGGAVNGDGTLGSLTTLRPGISELGGGKTFGPELTFGRTLADYYALTNGVSTNTVMVAIIKYAGGGTSLVTDWAANGNATTNGDGRDFVVFQKVVNAGLARLATAYPHARIELSGMIWVQGEADISTNDSASAYGTNLVRFINDVRLTYAEMQPYYTNLPFFLSRISTNQSHYSVTTDPDYPNYLLVRAGQQFASTNLGNVYMIDTDPPRFSTLTPWSSPGLHFDTQGQQSLGAAFGQSAIEALPPPQFQIPERMDGGWSLHFTGVSGTRHSIERANSVTGPWTLMTNIVLDATGAADFDDFNPLNSAGFYRVSRP